MSTRQRACMWTFEWKVIQHGACHGSQRKTSSHRLLQHKSCQSRGFFVFAQWSLTLFKADSAPPQWGWESESRRFGVWSRWGRGSPLGPDFFSQPRHRALLSGRTSAGLECIHFGHPSSSVSLSKLPKKRMSYKLLLVKRVRGRITGIHMKLT